MQQRQQQRELSSAKQDNDATTLAAENSVITYGMVWSGLARYGMACMHARTYAYILCVDSNIDDGAQGAKEEAEFRKPRAPRCFVCKVDTPKSRTVNKL